jgi:hypothetical protein
MLGFKDFRCARIILSGLEVMHMIRKGQMQDSGIPRTTAKQFYSLMTCPHQIDLSQPSILIATEPELLLPVQIRCIAF